MTFAQQKQKNVYYRLAKLELDIEEMVLNIKQKHN